MYGDEEGKRKKKKKKRERERRKKERKGGTGKLAQQVKVPATEVDGWSWILRTSLNPRPRMVEAENQLPQAVL